MSSVLYGSLGLTAFLSIASLSILPSRSQSLPACLPPRPDEYLLMVVNPTEAVQTQLRNALPSNATATLCTYLADTVLRVDGFNTPEVANSWAQYVSDASGVQTFIARPPIVPAPAIAPAVSPTVPAAPSPTPTAAFPQPTSLATPSPTPPTPAPTPAATPATPVATAPTAPTAPRYNPQPLGTGYAVLVDYANRPEVAIELRQILDREIGLVAYGQRPYLLAIQTPDLAVANQVLQTLSDRNFTAVLVDSESAILLTPVVARFD